MSDFETHDWHTLEMDETTVTQITELVHEAMKKAIPIKGIELSLAVLSNAAASYTRILPEQIVAVINSLAQRGEIIELEYILPDMDYRVKSLYFPKNTKVRFLHDTVTQDEAR